MNIEHSPRPEPKPDRLFSLDFLRGLDMIFLTVAVPILYAVHEVWGLPDGVMAQLRHPWEGFTAYDLIMPLFIFMCGAAIPLSLERRLAKRGGRPDAAYWKHVLGRVAMLWGLGLVVQGRVLSLDWDRIRLYDNTLQSIAAGYLAVACAILVPNGKVRLAIPVVCFAVYGALLHFLGDYSVNGNFAAVVEQNVLLRIVPATSETMKEIATCGILCAPAAVPPHVLASGVEIHYTWYLTTLMFAFMTFCGYYATKILQSAAPAWTRARNLFLYGAGLLALGWVLALCGVKMVKHVFTVSFTAQAMGWSALLLAALYVLTDIWKLRRGLGVVILFGQFALTAYLLEECFKPVLMSLAKLLGAGVPHLLGSDRCQPLVLAVLVAAEIVFALRIRRALKAKAARSRADLSAPRPASSLEEPHEFRRPCPQWPDSSSGGRRAPCANVARA